MGSGESVRSSMYRLYANKGVGPESVEEMLTPCRSKAAIQAPFDVAALPPNTALIRVGAATRLIAPSACGKARASVPWSLAK
jgi:hypothetical protein